MYAVTFESSPLFYNQCTLRMNSKMPYTTGCKESHLYKAVARQQQFSSELSLVVNLA